MIGKMLLLWQGLKRGAIVVAKKLVVNDFWLVANGDWASSNI